MPELRGLHWDGSALHFIEQTLLPEQLEHVKTQDWRVLVDAIKRLAIRGAPAIGVAGAFASLLAWREVDKDRSKWLDILDVIEDARPTAVNLSYAVKLLRDASQSISDDALDELLTAKAEALAIRDEEMCEEMAAHGLELIPEDASALTHCNTGALVTYGIGTALGVLRRGHDTGKVKRVYACEARPLGQGSRLTIWELDQLGIPGTLLSDSAAGRLMQEGLVDFVILGADRIASNGDTANKVGTFNLAVLAKRFGIPFYVAAPSTTFDPSTASGDDIVVEMRAADEVRNCRDRLVTIPHAEVYNPAFDITPGELVTAFVSEAGVHRPPYSFA
ncbi:S-methyl-5-thioribose-1-phosphate isomerase [bacterium]|nr:S-methyl-5-thioribose-1-phosphate isomerase [bacterium]